MGRLLEYDAVLQLLNMSPWNWASIALATLLYVVLYREIRWGTSNQNFLTFAFWGTLDGINGVTNYLNGGNYPLPLFYVFGCLSVLVAVLQSGKATFPWEWKEKLISGMVLFSIIAWMFSGPWYGALWSTFGVVIAGVLVMIDSWKHPEEQNIYWGFMIVNGWAMMAGKDWSMIEVFYPASCMVLCIVTALVPVMSREYKFSQELEAETVANYSLD